jgi:hypothetical protein
MVSIHFLYVLFFTLNVLVVAGGIKFLSSYTCNTERDMDTVAYVKFSIWVNAGLAALWCALAFLGN